MSNDDPQQVDSFRQRVYAIVAAIPPGHVTTYGTVARLAGSARAARQVGGILCRLPADSRLPWHRVVNRHGSLSLTGDDAERQRAALAREGIDCPPGAFIDLTRYAWPAA